MNKSYICPPCRRQLWQRISRTCIQHRNYTRPTFAPKPVIDIKHIRQNPGLYEQNCIDRNYKNHAKHSWRILDLFEQWQQQQKDGRKLREHNNSIRRQLSNAASLRAGVVETEESDGSDPPSRDALLAEAKDLKAKLASLEAQEKAISDEIDALALGLPNLSSHHTPNGSEPDVLGYINAHPEPTPSTSDRVWRSHVHIGSELDLLDFASAANTSGWGWYFLKNEAALLEQALVQYALSRARARGWTVVTPPSVVYAHVAAACGFQPRDQNDEQQIYALQRPEKDEGSDKPQLCLAGTAEIPFAAMRANTVLEESDLPLKVIGPSRCYRAEAGARGVDTKGLYRVHEFTKVEMFAWTLPDAPHAPSEHFGISASAGAGEGEGEGEGEMDAPSSSTTIFDEMVALQKDILESLGLHCRILEQPTHDLGASATRKIDIEAFFPSRRAIDDGWGEVTSASICTDYQTRRLATRVKTERWGRKHEWPHTVNGTAMAVPRVLAAVLENGWDERRGCVVVPECLRPWMGGLERIERRG